MKSLPHATGEGEVECLLGQHDRRAAVFYEHATVVFVGKSLTAIGGQNPIEPGALGKAMVFGPNMQNFADITRNFRPERGASKCRRGELEKALAELLADEKRRAELGPQRARVVRENLGAIDRTVEMILEHLKGRGNLHCAGKIICEVSPLDEVERAFHIPTRFGARRGS
jgi:3-deoxy-D-manno-octulosonic-acid transferase